MSAHADHSEIVALLQTFVVPHILTQVIKTIWIWLAILLRTRRLLIVVRYHYDVFLQFSTAVWESHCLCWWLSWARLSFTSWIFIWTDRSFVSLGEITSRQSMLRSNLLKIMNLRAHPTPGWGRRYAWKYIALEVFTRLEPFRWQRRVSSAFGRHG